MKKNEENQDTKKLFKEADQKVVDKMLEGVKKREEDEKDKSKSD